MFFDKLSEILPKQEGYKPVSFTCVMGEIIQGSSEKAEINREDLVKKNDVECISYTTMSGLVIHSRS